VTVVVTIFVAASIWVREGLRGGGGGWVWEGGFFALLPLVGVVVILVAVVVAARAAEAEDEDEEDEGGEARNLLPPGPKSVGIILIQCEVYYLFTTTSCPKR
jgi:uncharacterized membrane protein